MVLRYGSSCTAVRSRRSWAISLLGLVGLLGPSVNAEALQPPPSVDHVPRYNLTSEYLSGRYSLTTLTSNASGVAAVLSNAATDTYYERLSRLPRINLASTAGPAAASGLARISANPVRVHFVPDSSDLLPEADADGSLRVRCRSLIVPATGLLGILALQTESASVVQAKRSPSTSGLPNDTLTLCIEGDGSWPVGGLLLVPGALIRPALESPARVLLVPGYQTTASIPEDYFLRWLLGSIRRAEGARVKVGIVRMPRPDQPDAGWLRTLQEWAGSDPVSLRRTYFVGHSAGCYAVLRYIASLPPGVGVAGAVCMAGFLTPLARREVLAANRILSVGPVTPADLRAHSAGLVSVNSLNDPFVTDWRSQRDRFARLGARAWLTPTGRHLNSQAGYTAAFDALTTLGL